MGTWIICIAIALIFIVAGIAYSILAPAHRVEGSKKRYDDSIKVNDKGWSMDDRYIYTIPYNKVLAQAETTDDAKPAEEQYSVLENAELIGTYLNNENKELRD